MSCVGEFDELIGVIEPLIGRSSRAMVAVSVGGGKLIQRGYVVSRAAQLTGGSAKAGDLGHLVGHLGWRYWSAIWLGCSASLGRPSGRSAWPVRGFGGFGLAADLNCTVEC